MVFSAMTTSCAGGGGGGSAGSGNGGSAGSGNGGTSGGNGGSTGSGSCTAGSDGICFSAGKASGLMSGYGWIAMGQFNSASEPVCDNTANGGTASDAITKATPCPSTGGKTVWTTPDAGLCITGSVPKVGTTTGVTGPDYTGYWGLELGANSDTSSGTIDISGYTSVSFSYNDSAISPAPTGLIRGEIHVKGHTPSDESYCAVLKGSGQGALLTSFNTQCWQGGAGVALTAADMKNIDQMGLQISSDTTNDYKVSGFCWSGVSFTK
jgi:hypothetical protein